MVDIGNHSSIYHLHIPRTAGIFIKNHLKDVFSDRQIFATHNKPIDDKYLKNSYYVGGHFSGYPINVMNNPTVFTVLRDPVERFISYYKYTRHLFPQYKDNELLDRWLYDDRFSGLQSNAQFKSITGTLDVEKYNKFLVDHKTIEENWFIINHSDDIKDGQEFIDNNHVFIFDNIEKLTTSICSLLNIPQFKNLYKYNTSDKSDYNISKSQYDRIIELNQLDMEIYQYAKRKEKEHTVVY